MEQKLTKIDVIQTLCDRMGGNCYNCPYYHPERKARGHCDIWEEVSKFFSSIIPPKQWVKTTYDRYYEDEKVCCNTFENYTIVIDAKKEKMGIAKCKKGDKFNNMIGTAIAYARLRGLPVHPEYASKTDKVLGRDD